MPRCRTRRVRTSSRDMANERGDDVAVPSAGNVFAALSYPVSVEWSYCPASVGNGESVRPLRFRSKRMRKERKHFAPEEKVAILKRHLVDKVPVRSCVLVTAPPRRLLLVGCGTLCDADQCGNGFVA
jgi:hypothetical protein